MKINQWTLGLAGLPLILATVANAEEQVSFVQTAVSGTTISGYVDTSVEWAITPSHDVINIRGIGSTDYDSFHTIPFRAGKQDGFNLNVVELNISKALDETPWASGYNVSLLYGPDAVGWNPSANSKDGSDFAIKDANVVLRVPVGNGLDIKIGVFDTIIGYEVFEAGNNPNFTRSWGYAIEPTQHTGVLFTYHINDNIAISAGVANTLMTGINTGDRYSNDAWDKTGLASITLTAPQSWGWAAGATFSAGIVYGFNGVVSDAVNVYAGLTIPTPIKGLSFGVAFDYLTYCADYHDGDIVAFDSGPVILGSPGHTDFIYDGQQHIEAYTIALYGTWQATEKLSLNLRGEFVDAYSDDSGHFTAFQYDGQGGFLGSYTGPSDNHFSTYDVEVWAITATLQYNLWANVISRIEARYDKVVNYCDCPDEDQFSVYLNVIYKF